MIPQGVPNEIPSRTSMRQGAHVQNITYREFRLNEVCGLISMNSSENMLRQFALNPNLAKHHCIKPIFFVTTLSKTAPAQNFQALPNWHLSFHSKMSNGNRIHLINKEILINDETFIAFINRNGPYETADKCRPINKVNIFRNTN
jgi:hypothetical protein